MHLDHHILNFSQQFLLKEPRDTYRNSVTFIIRGVLLSADILLKRGRHISFRGFARAGQQFLYRRRSLLMICRMMLSPGDQIRDAHHLEQRLCLLRKAAECTFPNEDVYAWG